MRKRFEEILHQLNYDELMQLKQDMDSRGLTTKQAVEETIKHKQKEHEKACATCSASLRAYTKHNYTLVFGPDDFKKKASFCGLDCLQHFLNQLRGITP